MELMHLMERMGLDDIGVDPGLLDIAIFGTRADIKHRTLYPWLNGNKQLKFLGDRVLKLIHGEWIFRDLIKTDNPRIQKINPTLQSLEMNATFQCYLAQMGNVCEGIVHPRSRACANIFEAVVGSIYYTNMKSSHEEDADAVDENQTALQKVQAWLKQSTPAVNHLQHLRTIDQPCSYCNGASYIP
jgi:dsRNA-specific ribonuclease